MLLRSPSASSEAGNGIASTNQLVLPPSEWASDKRTGDADNPAHVLVVEDDQASARVLEAKLIAGGHRITLATGATVQQQVLADPPDLVLSDVCMPELDGVQLTRWLRNQTQTAHVPIVLVTAMDDSKILAQGLAAGADDFLTKPVNSLELRTRVRSLLRTKNLIDELLVRRQASDPFAAFQSLPGHAATLNGTTSLEAPAASAAKTDRILIVDDHDTERTMLTVFLQDMQCEVRTAPDGRSGLAMLTQDPPDLIVLDLVLPDISGYELIRQIKNTPELARIPILVISVMCDVQDRVKAIDLGADDFIVKGFDRVEFKARIQRLLRMKQCLDSLNHRCEDALRLAVTDRLTGVFTHGFLQELVHREVPAARQQNKSLSLLFIDIDHFKAVNDRYGHAVGDDVLRSVAHCLRDSVRSCDTVARYGGEEFVILLPQTKRDEALKLAERLRASVATLSAGAAHGQRISVTISVGVANYPEDGAGATELLQHADEALYAAKQAGRNRVVAFGQDPSSLAGQPRVLIVDDEEKNIRLLEAYLSLERYQTIRARDGEEALEAARHAAPDLILLDAMMPRLSGFDVCRRLKREQATCLIPVVLVTALSSREDKLRGIEAGADDFLTKPVNKTELMTRVKALLRFKRTTDVLENAETVIFALARAVESRDPSTGGHVERVSHYVVELGKALGLPDIELEGLRRAGVVHDIGKVVVPDSVLLKPGKLTPEERRIMERHVEAGYEILKPLRTFAESLPAVRFHHERLNGSGYPFGLKGDQVPLVAQVMAVVDVYDALTTDRVYRAALPQREAFQVLRDEAVRGLHDPQLVELFLRTV